MKLVREHINEKFIEDSDPVHDMGVGVGSYFEKICKSLLENDKDKIFFTIQYMRNYKVDNLEYVRIHINEPRMNDFKDLQSNDALRNYIKEIIAGLNYNDIFIKIALEGKFKHYRVDIDEDYYLLSNVPQIYCFINPKIKIKIRYCKFQRDHSDLNKILHKE